MICFYENSLAWCLIAIFCGFYKERIKINS